MSTADAVDRETAWLRTSGDGLPVLLSTGGGLWQIIQAYWPGPKFESGKTGLYVQRSRVVDRRSAGIRVMPRYVFDVKVVWPIRNVTGSGSAGIAETEQRNLDIACDALITRIRGQVRDKTHGGRFLSVGETPSGQPPEIVWEDAEETMPLVRGLRGKVTYVADDFEING